MLNKQKKVIIDHADYCVILKCFYWRRMLRIFFFLVLINLDKQNLHLQFVIFFKPKKMSIYNFHICKYFQQKCYRRRVIATSATVLFVISANRTKCAAFSNVQLFSADVIAKCMSLNIAPFYWTLNASLHPQNHMLNVKNEIHRLYCNLTQRECQNIIKRMKRKSSICTFQYKSLVLTVELVISTYIHMNWLYCKGYGVSLVGDIFAKRSAEYSAYS